MKITYLFNLQTSETVDQAEFDPPETIDFITNSLRKLGHTVDKVDASIPTENLVKKLLKFKPDIVFNTAEGIRGASREAFYPALLENLNIPYTGSDAYVNTLTLDKGLTKLVLAKYKIRTPQWEFVDNLSDIKDVNLKYPLIIKPNFEGSSKGIDLDSIVENPSQLVEKIKRKLAMFKEGLIIEEYIEGTDIAVPFLELYNTGTKGTLPPIEYMVNPELLKERKYNIYDYDLKHIYNDSVVVKIFKTSDERMKLIMETSAKIFNALNLRDFGRIDYRMTGDGKLYFFEVNALPSLQNDSGIYLSAAEVGMKKYTVVLEKILLSACKRYKIDYKRNLNPRSSVPTVLKP